MYTYNYYLEAFEAAKNIIHLLIDDVHQDTFNMRPAEGKWCIGEILSHLIQTDKKYLEVLEAKIYADTSSLPKGSGPYKHPIHMRWFIKVVSPEFKKAVPTVSAFEPLEIEKLDKSKLLAEFDDIQNRYLALIKKAKHEDLHLGKVKVSNPLYSFIKMSISACLAVNEAHQRRHFQQIENIIS